MITATIVPMLSTMAMIAIPRRSDFYPIHARNTPIAFKGKAQPHNIKANGIPTIPSISAMSANMERSVLMDADGMKLWVVIGAGGGVGGATISGATTSGGVGGMISL